MKSARKAIGFALGLTVSIHITPCQAAYSRLLTVNRRKRSCTRNPTNGFKTTFCRNQVVMEADEHNDKPKQRKQEEACIRHTASSFSMHRLNYLDFESISLLIPITYQDPKIKTFYAVSCQTDSVCASAHSLSARESATPCGIGMPVPISANK